MAAAVEAGKVESLGDLVNALRPGEPCPWCGAKLLTSPGSPVGSGDGRTRHSQGSDAVVLFCADCGAEISESARSRVDLGAGSLEAAA